MNTKSDIELMSRIEEQLLDKYKNTIKCISSFEDKEELFMFFVDVINFWIDERPIIKFPSLINYMKQNICDYRIRHIINISKVYYMDEALKVYFHNKYNF